MRTLPATQKASIFTIILFLVSVGMYILFYQHISALRSELSFSRAEYLSLTQQEERARALDALVVDTENQKTELDEKFLSLENPIPFLDLIETLGAEAGVVLEVESIVEEVENKKSADADEQGEAFVRAVLSVSGNWNEIYHLIVLIDFLPYATIIERAAIEQIEKEDVMMWDGQIHIRTGIRQ